MSRTGIAARGATIPKLLAEQAVQGALARNYVYLNGQPLALVNGATTTATYTYTAAITELAKAVQRRRARPNGSH
jgi:hypothetical protein